MDKKISIIILLGVLILVLICVFAIPKVTNTYKMEGLQQGIAVCQQQIMNTLVGDLSTRGYTTLTVGNKIITLGIIPTEEQRQAILAQQAAQQEAEQGGEEE